MKICIATGTEGLIADTTLFAKALTDLDNEVEVLTPVEISRRIKRHPLHDLFIIVTRGNDVDFYAKTFAGRPFTKLAVWYLSTKTDSGKHFPTSFAQAEYIASKGGWVFFAQYTDFLESFESTHRVSWLPVGVDVDLYSPATEDRQIVYDVCLMGAYKEYLVELKKLNRLGAIRYSEFDSSSPADVPNKLHVSKLALHMAGGIYNKYDMTPLVYGAMSAGIPLLTNASDSLPRLFDRPIYLRTYQYERLEEELQAALGNDVFLTSGRFGRENTVRRGSFAFRAIQMLDALKDQKVIQLEEKDNGQISRWSKK